MDQEEGIVPHHNDILLGRGGKNNQHVGNEQLRNLARSQRDHYRHSSKKGKSYISRQIVAAVRNMEPPGRFLKRNTATGTWEDVGDDVAREKAAQALRDAVSALHNSSKPSSPERGSDAAADFIRTPLDGRIDSDDGDDDYYWQEHRRSSSAPATIMRGPPSASAFHSPMAVGSMRSRSAPGFQHDNYRTPRYHHDPAAVDFAPPLMQSASGGEGGEGSAVPPCSPVRVSPESTQGTPQHDHATPDFAMQGSPPHDHATPDFATSSRIQLTPISSEDAGTPPPFSPQQVGYMPSRSTPVPPAPSPAACYSYPSRSNEPYHHQYEPQPFRATDYAPDTSSGNVGARTQPPFRHPPPRRSSGEGMVEEELHATGSINEEFDLFDGDLLRDVKSTEDDLEMKSSTF